LCFFGIIAGLIQRWTHRYKLLQIIGLGIKIIGMGLLVSGGRGTTSIVNFVFIQREWLKRQLSTLPVLTSSQCLLAVEALSPLSVPELHPKHPFPIRISVSSSVSHLSQWWPKLTWTQPCSRFGLGLALRLDPPLLEPYGGI
jgi:hypothetical protein